MQIERIVQIGTVINVNNTSHKARVQFKETGIISEWLSVLDNRAYIPSYEGTQHTEAKAGGSGEAAFESHTHDLNILQWMPKINDTVVVLYMPVDDSDGFVLGAIRE